NDLYETQPEFDPRAHLPEAPALTGHVRFENLSFRYIPDGKNILSGINLEIPPGRRVALVGRSGPGKTTLAMLLQRLFDPTEGRIVVDGCELTKVDVRSYREQVGVVSQDSTMFSGTIRENIALADPDSGLDRIIAVARLANAHDFIMALPMGYETVVGDAGVRLWAETADLHRPRATARSPHPDLRRGDIGPRHRIGKSHPGKHEADARGTNLLHHCTSPLNRSGRRPDCRAGRGNDRGKGNAS
ncbi:MAG: ATP-binding cassette domain-containing protein, partial [Planctomycetota bacterium]|nr:ATP-binding cassette domain-containing protein [Planctomycetota bacterium]